MNLWSFVFWLDEKYSITNNSISSDHTNKTTVETSDGWSLYNGLISKPYTIEGELIKAITSITVNNFRYLVKINGLNKICV